MPDIEKGQSEWGERERERECAVSNHLNGQRLQGMTNELCAVSCPAKRTIWIGKTKIEMDITRSQQREMLTHIHTVIHKQTNGFHFITHETEQKARGKRTCYTM